MDDVIICPNCGEANPADLPYCHSCQWRLKSLDSDWGTDRGTTGDTVSAPGSSDNPIDGQFPDWLLQPKSEPRPEDSEDEAAAAQLRDRLAAEGAEDLQAPGRSAREPEDLLAGLTRAEQPDDEPIPDWVARIMGIPEDDSSTETTSDESPSQFQNARDPESPERWQTEGPARPLGAVEDSGEPLPLGRADWPEQENQPALRADPGAGSRESEDIYEWLRQLDASGTPSPIPRAGKDVPATTDVPTWVDRMMSVSAEAAADAEDRSSSLPEWLRTTTPAVDQSAPSPSAPPSELLPPSELPTASDEGESQLGAEPLVGAETPSEIPGSLDEPEGGSFDVDAVFAAMDMPQWSNPSGLTQSSDGAPPAAGNAEAPIAPADLPSWVRAMRPLESGVVVPSEPESVSSQEAGSPLLGLQGVLPAIPGAFAPYSRPKAHAMRLEVSEQHRSQAHLLDEILEAEAHPVQFRGKPPAAEHRLLRWLIAALLIATLATGLISTPGGFLLPASVPNETNAALQIVQNLPADASVLAVFDYEPALAGEMEVAGASLMDHLLLLKHPRLALISTSPTGSVLAERFMSNTLRERAYTRDVQYVDLGYLPGGLSGVQLFAQNPVAALPYGAATDRVWESQVLQGTADLADFSAIVVLTDSQEGGTAWVEQTTGRRGAVPMVIIASAQAGPMLLPYYDSGQIQGLLIGINGAAGAEIANGGRPGFVRRYWDAYNIGLYAAVGFIILGTLWGFFSATIRRKTEAT